MMAGWLATALVGGYVAVVALGHVCLAVAIYQCLRGDHVDGRRQRQLAPDPLTARDVTPSLHPQTS